MQTAAVQTRRPRRTIAALGVTGYLAGLALCVGTVATALFGPVFLVVSLHAIWAGDLLRPAGAPAIAAATFALTLFVAGIATTVASALLALRRMEIAHLAPWLWALPVYYLFVSAAAWRAVVELIFYPQHWNKTEHGLARTSRRTAGKVDPRGLD